MPPAPARPRATPDRTSAMFVHLTLITCLCLQRFGLPFAGGELFLSTLVFPLLVGWMLLTGRARFDAVNLLLYVLVAACFAISTFSAVLFPDYRFGFSFPSLMEVSVIYVFLTVAPSDRFDRTKVLEIFLFYARLLCVAGIVQYMLQFAGLKIFSFSYMFPQLSPILTESGFHVMASLKYGSPIYRSNGLLLLEPSLFSQLIALAVLTDYFLLKRVKFLPLYLLAYICSYSGTGLLVLCVTVVVTSLGSLRQMQRTAAFAVVAGLAAVMFLLLFPAEFSTIAGRSNELQSAGTSGNQRYTAQIGVLSGLASETRLAIGYGPGAQERYIHGVEGSASVIQKLLIDYGLLGLTMFAVFLVKVVWRRRLALLSIGLLFMFLLGGGYLLFSPFIFLTALLCIWAESSPSVVVRPVRTRRTVWANGRPVGPAAATEAVG